jgi:SAM-dependent methyltransferase
VRAFIAESWEAGSHSERTFACPVCLSAISYFKPLPTYFLDNMAKYDYAHPFFQTETMNFSQYMCPRCGANDRERLYILYLRERLIGQPCRFIDFAPGHSLPSAIRALPGVSYRSADLMDPRADDVVDITAIPYPDASTGAFLCSHILEHVEDDSRALAELYRILRPGGFGILMVPLVDGIEQTIESPLIASEADRWKWYGQDDHVRQYAKADFVRRIEAAGFIVSQLGADHFGAETFARHGIHRRSVLYVAERPA